VGGVGQLIGFVISGEFRLRLGNVEGIALAVAEPIQNALSQAAILQKHKNNNIFY